MVDRNYPTPTQALSIAESVFSSRYGGASFAYVAGSIMRGEGTHLSDIDLVVVYDTLDAARRESFIAEGIPVEAFVHDDQTLAWFVNEDVTRGEPSILNMIVEGTVIGPKKDRAEALRQHMVVRLADGPPTLSPAALNAMRYAITDAVDDLAGDRTAEEVMAIGSLLYPRLVELSLRGRGRWNGTGKWAPRLLAEVSPDLAGSFECAFRALFTSGDVDPVMALAETELGPHGGRLFDGDRREAPSSWRVN